MLFICKTLSLLPFSLLYLLADALYIFIYKWIGYRKKVVRNNLKKAFPELNEQERLSLEIKFYRNFCDFIVELVKSLSVHPTRLSENVVFTNLDEIKALFAKHRSVLMLAAHQFNWEWMQLSASLQFPVPLDYIYQPLHNKGSDDFMLFLRNRFGASPIKRRESARQIVKRKSEGKGFAVVADQFPSGRDKKQWVKFLNNETAFFQSIDQLARLADIPVAYFNIERVSRGKYQVTMTILSLTPRDEPEGEIVKKYSRIIEENILGQPENWLWSHNRWKKPAN